MKKLFNKFLTMMGMMNALGIKPEVAEAAGMKLPKPRFVAGDHFYKQLQFKRVKGKWRCKR
jgi:hypothetical protein